MHGHQARRLTEQAHPGFVLVDKHVARRRTHEELDTGNARRVELGEEVGIIVGSPEEEGIVHVAVLPRTLKLILKCFERRGLRNGVGHVEVARHAARRCRPALGLDAGFLRKSRLAEMYMTVNNARQDETARSIDHLVGRCFGMPGFVSYLSNNLILNHYIALERPPFIDDTPAFHQYSHVD